LSPRLPQVMADARSVRQIVLNLLSNSIKFTVAGGQVIVSTAIADNGEVVLRVRDTGIGMTEKDLATALEPFRQVATTTRARSGGTGLGLPLTKALAEANHATFNIKSTPNEGTLVEIAFRGARLMAAQ
jgi:signal transduction histidine kinase